MKPIKRWATLAIVFVAALAPSSTASAQSDYTYAYIRALDGEATVQRAIEPAPEDAAINLPVMSGDRLWSAANSRVELRYGDGTLVRMGALAKVDFLEFEPEKFVRVWNGSLYVRTTGGGTFRLDSPAGSVYPTGQGTFRVDVYEGGQSMTLSVVEGLAEFVTPQGSVLVRAGQRSVAEAEARPSAPFEFNTARWDELDQWNDERDRAYQGSSRLEGIPDEVDDYVDELDEYGDWEVHETYGSVWYPTATTVDWAPYSTGRWCYTSYGYTWVGYEPWGWAPYHYGRWGHGSRGYFWIPGAHWSPAWVSWSIGSSFIGWSALGYYDRPIYGYNDLYYRGGRYGRRGRGGKAIPRDVYERGGGWQFARRGNLDARHARGRLRAADVRGTQARARARVHENGAILNRDLSTRSVGAAEMTRATRSPARARGRGSFNRNAVGERNRTTGARRGGATRRGGVVGSSQSGRTERLGERSGTARSRGSVRGSRNDGSLRRGGQTPVVRGGESNGNRTRGRTNAPVRRRGGSPVIGGRSSTGSTGREGARSRSGTRTRSESNRSSERGTLGRVPSRVRRTPGNRTSQPTTQGQRTSPNRPSQRTSRPTPSRRGNSSPGVRSRGSRTNNRGGVVSGRSSTRGNRNVGRSSSRSTTRPSRPSPNRATPPRSNAPRQRVRPPSNSSRSNGAIGSRSRPSRPTTRSPSRNRGSSRSTVGSRSNSRSRPSVGNRPSSRRRGSTLGSRSSSRSKPSVGNRSKGRRGSALGGGGSRSRSKPAAGARSSGSRKSRGGASRARRRSNNN